MRCPKCNALLEEGSKFCIVCGAQILPEEEKEFLNEQNMIVENSSTEPQKSSRVKSNFKIIIGIVQLFVSVIVIIIGFVIVSSAGTSISSTSFGADFYTYTYRGIVAISEILASIEKAIGWLIVSVGAFIGFNALKR